ncbi:MAG: DUF434 domain-containing protein [Spirochaetia bacterium]
MRLSDNFFKAVEDYRYLLNRKYPYKPSLKLTADRYRLSGTERTILLRGILSDSEAEMRKAKKVMRIDREILHIDLPNVISTITNYHLGRFMFMGMDGFLRDDGENYPADHDSGFRNKSMSMISAFTKDREVNCRIYINRVDDELTADITGIICTADGEIINRTPDRVFDLSYAVLNAAYRPSFLKLPVS